MQTVLLAQKAGVVKMGHLAIDATKAKANATPGGPRPRSLPTPAISRPSA